MKRLLLTLLVIAAALPFSRGAQAAVFSVEVTAIQTTEENLEANPNVRNAKCKETLYVDGWIDKPNTGMAYGGYYRWIDSNGQHPQIGTWFGMAANLLHAAYNFTVLVPINTTAVVWAQLELLKPEHHLSNKLNFTLHCRAKPKPMQIAPGTFPH
jgi:hypothetical protein